MNQLVELKKISPRISLEILYATEKNFIKKSVYPSAHCFLLKNTAFRLHQVQLAVEKMNLGLKVYDGYRPHSVSKVFWDFLPDPRYVADPALGSRHNRGAAVDLTLIDPEGNELPMPTEFDDFTEKAHRNYQRGDPELLKNRQILEEAMVSAGFVPFAYEWWHFDDPEWEKYPVLDVSFQELLVQ